jgi:hypothetical protein
MAISFALTGSPPTFGPPAMTPASPTAAAWCYLIIHAVRSDEDITCLLADPITSEREFRELLAWALTGRVAARYRRHLAPVRPVASQTLTNRARRVIAAVHPALAADCLQPLTPVATRQSQAKDHRSARDDRCSRGCITGQIGRPHPYIAWNCPA